MNIVSRTITVRTRKIGFHYWPNASEHRNYLEQRHRHLFHIAVTLEVRHQDREVEFHDLLAVVNDSWPASGELGPGSCEMMCERVASAVFAAFGDRRITVSVEEDGEAGATLTFEA